MSIFSRTGLLSGAFAALLVAAALVAPPPTEASSHREAPLIADDPLADNTDVYAFRSPDDPSSVTIVANYIPLALPEGGPNYSHFGENVRYEIHIKNQTSVGELGSATDDITYRWTFERENGDPTTFFNIRLGEENLNTSYTLEKSIGGGAFQTIISDGPTPPANIGPRSITSGVGLGTSYEQLTTAAIAMASTGERAFAGPRDDPFFVDLGGVFDLGGIRQDYGPNPEDEMNARDAVAGFNTHTLALQIPISQLQKDNQPTPDNILDPDFVIGVWASASRQQITTLSTDGSAPTPSGDFVQVSRLGMPLTNEVIIPIGDKDRWNYTSPYDEAEQSFAQYFVNPELGLYMGNGQFGPAVPALSDNLRIATNSFPAIGDPDEDGEDGFNFNNGEDGVFDLVEGIVNGNVPPEAIEGTAFEVPLRPLDASSPTALAADNQPRRVDLLPIFYFGVPNLNPYQLATGKTAGPLSDGKPFIHNFLPITQTPDGALWGGDMLRLNMATPTTDRDSEEFQDWARLGLIRAAAIGLTVPDFATTDLEFIPHMDGFPNGRRLEDDVTGIELQAVGGLVLAAVGLPFDDATEADYSDLASPFLLDALNFLAGPTKNDLPFRPNFPYLANPHNGYSYVKQLTAEAPDAVVVSNELETGRGTERAYILHPNFPNPARDASTVRFYIDEPSRVRVDVFDVTGRLVTTLADGEMQAGTHDLRWDTSGVASGSYVYRLQVNGDVVAAKSATVIR